MPPVSGCRKRTHLGFVVILLAVFLDRKGDIFGTQFFAGGERPARAAAQLADDVAQIFLDDPLA